jgi:hypothetical protein
VNLPELIDARPVAKALFGDESKIGRVYELARAGIIPCVRLGRTVRFDPERVRELVEGGGQALPGGWRHADESSDAIAAR